MAAAVHVCPAMTPGGEFWQHDASTLTEFLSQGKVSATDLLDHFLTRTSKLNSRINAFVAINDRAQHEAEESDRRRAQDKALSPIDGLPVAVKDNLVVKNMPCTWGSRLFAKYVPDQDEIPMQRLRALGAVILGKTNVPEFTLEGYTANDIFGVTRNPWNLDLTPGGSSGGSVAAVAAGLVPIALGTDGGGSIRRPAGYTGLVGLKPSIGRIARGNGFPQLLLDFEVVGPIAHTVRDCRMIYGLLAGDDPRDHRSMLFCGDIRKEPDQLRILYVEQFSNAPIDPIISKNVAEAAGVLKSRGHQVESGQLPFDITATNEFWPMIGEFSLAGIMAGYPDFREKAAPQYIDMANAGRALSAETVHSGLKTIWALRNAVSEAFQRYDIIMTPTSAAMPWPAAQEYPEFIDGEAVGRRGHAVYTGWVNACGHPAIALPAAPTEDGVPIGFQLVAGFGQEPLLFDLAEAFEQEQPWAERWPILAEEE